MIVVVGFGRFRNDQVINNGKSKVLSELRVIFERSGTLSISKHISRITDITIVAERQRTLNVFQLETLVKRT